MSDPFTDPHEDLPPGIEWRKAAPFIVAVLVASGVGIWLSGSPLERPELPDIPAAIASAAPAPTRFDPVIPRTSTPTPAPSPAPASKSPHKAATASPTPKRDHPPARLSQPPQAVSGLRPPALRPARPAAPKASRPDRAKSAPARPRRPRSRPPVRDSAPIPRGTSMADAMHNRCDALFPAGDLRRSACHAYVRQQTGQ
ncbi:hypothetical protein GCM10010156_75910 [Planobispora rosea]|uniref:Uncharacterized protein n=1 Tax=Planobispora rosea TaxID=35762 RepID=A0A8J3SGM5_PLARO|nr:hypothetical protein [Planobispora rosea]GGT07495.1 hypothetical protein GCM10010156_75910 [Planobispora rosea]GIH89338.1 hypothetical protein Pro02_77460 [Planobispora rosea]